ncbi:MAG TPA: type II 3-dehydroquinate dehydratase [Clostridia bacterium]|nr:type II 3-dehydroquinate dehydratase [Clostridia bacterium]
MNISVINGPNINMLGVREPQHYGSETWPDIEHRLENLAKEHGVDISFFQSNHEGAIVDYIQDNIYKIDGVVINPAAYTKTGYAILDALTSIKLPFVEVHLSNIFSRGGWHAESVFAEKAIGHVIGFRGYGYELGLMALMKHINIKKKC